MDTLEKSTRALRRRQLIASIGGGLTALAGMAATMAGAPRARSAVDPVKLTSRARELYDAEVRAADTRASRRSAQALAYLRAGADTDLKRRAENRAAAEDAARSADRQAASLRADTQLELRAADTASRIAAREESAAARREAAEARRTRAASRPAPSGSRQGAARNTFTWVHPDTGERYEVERNTWDKSSYTMFQLVVDATRPKPDSRGYPSVEEWRRHCFDTYTTADRRDAYIMRHLPEVKPAIDYLQRIRRQT